jgi:ketosteroid isomerase-like protein
MYRFIVKQQLRRGFRHLSAGDHEYVLKSFGPRSLFVFAGDHAFGGERLGVDAIRAVFEKMRSSFPDLRIEPQEVIVRGWPHNTLVATRFLVTATLPDGQPYRNEGMQFLRLRFGRVVEDRLFEDTQKLAAALDRVASHRAEEVVGATV